MSLFLELLPRHELVIGMLLLVQVPQPDGLLDEWLSLLVAQRAPLLSELLADLGVVQIRLLGQYSSAPHLGPYHKGVHRALDTRFGCGGVQWDGGAVVFGVGCCGRGG